ncbi:MAG: hypothetical protein M3Y72_11130 [Acidobacteriota bacterium]|nr:hypothetical protein [Acidobacteriota bacterium]
MSIRMVVLPLLAFASFASEDASHPLTAREIMKRVAENQDREQNARTQFVYEENVHRTMRRKDGKLLREEYRTFSVTPGVKGTEKKLQSVKGRYWKKGHYVAFKGEPVPEPGLFSITFDDDGDSQTKDGVDKDLFPLTSDEQKNYEFELAGERVFEGRPAYRIQFRPPNRKDYGWTGEALIDKEELQPVSVYTRLSRRLPLAVRTALGTDVPGLGFTVSYTRLDKDLWFPSSYGTEFGVHALFLFNRTFTESLENKNFRRASVESRVKFGDGPATH